MAPDAPARRFAPTPVETSTSSNRHAQANKAENASAGPRKFAVQPVEESARSSHKSDDKPRRFAPQQIGESTNTSRRSGRQANGHQVEEQDTQSQDKPRRRFAPQLIDTASRSRKSSDCEPTWEAHHKTDAAPTHIKIAEPTLPEELESSSSRKGRRIPLPHERRKDRTESHGSMRSHSFRCPELETIESSESEQSEHSDAPSLSSTPSNGEESPLTGSEGQANENYKHATRVRESIDESFSKYMLDLEARRAVQKMHEQALAAFPNSDFHEPVAHYAGEDEGSEEMDIDDRPATWDGHDEDEDEDDFRTARSRRRSSDDDDWEMRELRKRKEDLESARGSKNDAKRNSTTKSSPWWSSGVLERPKDTQASHMRNSARPPMLGFEITFPRSTSPEPARFDVTQRRQVVKNQVNSAAPSRSGSPERGLWGAAPIKITKSNESGKKQGLWGGFCTQSSEVHFSTIRGPTGLLTPAAEHSNPFETAMGSLSAAVSQPPSPAQTRLTVKYDMSRVDSMLNSDEELDQLMEREFPDTFVTQVYNYLSLGYPSLARPFDEELSKISRFGMVDLREDDQLAKTMPKGYIRFGDDFEGRGDGVDQALQNGGCARWRALKSYIREWARQEKGMTGIDELDRNWGTGARKGSWAW